MQIFRGDYLMYRIAIIRSASSAVSKSQYNIQEIGLAKELAKLGMSVDVFLISDKDKTYHESLGFENRVTVYWMKGIKLPGQQGYYKDLMKILNKYKYDLIQALDDSQITTVLISRYCKKNNIKFVLWQGMYENYPERYKRMIQYVYDWTLLKVLRNNTKYTIAKTTSAAKYLDDKKFVKATVIPVGLEIANFQGGECRDYRERLNIPKNKKIMLYVGKVEERRKPIFCIDVYKAIKEHNDDWCLVYVGKGPMLEETHAYVKNNNINDVIFIDQIPQNQLAPLYEISDLFILPTRYEIFGMVLMEAMYFELPVITYKAAGPLDVIDNSVDGILLDNFNVNEWACTIETYDTQNGKFKQMGEAARKKMQKKYMWNYIAKCYFDEYVKIINNK